MDAEIEDETDLRWLRLPINMRAAEHVLRKEMLCAIMCRDPRPTGYGTVPDISSFIPSFQLSQRPRCSDVLHYAGYMDEEL